MSPVGSPIATRITASRLASGNATTTPEAAATGLEKGGVTIATEDNTSTRVSSSPDISLPFLIICLIAPRSFFSPFYL